MDVRLGRVRRVGNGLELASEPGSAIETVITVSAREAVQTLLKVLTTPSGLLFVVGLPWFWLRQTLGWGDAARATDARAPGPADINKPW